MRFGWSFPFRRRFHPLHRLKCSCCGLRVTQVHLFRIQHLALMCLGEMCFQISVCVKSPLATVTFEFDVGNLGAVIFIVGMQLLEMSLGIELKTEDGRTQVTLVGLDLFRRSLAAASRRRWVIKVHYDGL